jgi:hypothetical protein
MARRLAKLLPRLVALTLIWLLAASSLTFAAAGRRIQERSSRPAAAPKPKQETLVVPEVRGQAYVFAKGILEDAGLAWRVEGTVRGYAANLVSAQNPAPGTRVLDEGAPTIVLTLAKNPGHAERGLPDDHSPYSGSVALLADGTPAVVKTAPLPDPKPVKRARRAPRPPRVSAVAQPEGELPLPERARVLARYLAGQPHATDEVVRHWLYQHGWIVAGARMGWRDGAEALRLLIRIDTDLQARWGFGARSAALARDALAEVERTAR